MKSLKGQISIKRSSLCQWLQPTASGCQPRGPDECGATGMTSALPWRKGREMEEEGGWERQEDGEGTILGRNEKKKW